MSKKILIAEDDDFLVNMYKMNLKKVGAEITVALNGEEAIAEMDKQQPDLAILDLLMPKVDGFGVVDHIKKKGYKFPYIILSNLDEEISGNKCSEMGATECYVKSDMDLDDLVDKVKKYIS